MNKIVLYIKKKRESCNKFWVLLFLIRDFKLGNTAHKITLLLYPFSFLLYPVDYLFSKILKNFTNLNNRIVLLSTPRSGSNLLINLLNNNNFLAVKELFNQRNQPDGWDYLEFSFLGKIYNFLFNRLFPLSFLEYFYYKNKNKEAVIFKIFPNHRRRALNYILRDNSFKIIILKRKNILKKYISNRIAEKTNIWRISKKTTDKEKKIYFDSENFTFYCRQQNKLISEIENNKNLNKHKMYHIYYEDFMNDFEKIMDVVIFFGFRKYHIDKNKIGIVKQGSDNLFDHIKNKEELREYLKNNDLLHLIDL